MFCVDRLDMSYGSRSDHDLLLKCSVWDSSRMPFDSLVDQRGQLVRINNLRVKTAPSGQVEVASFSELVECVGLMMV